MLLFSDKPGRHERHLLRKRNNPLFAEDQRKVSSAALQEAQRLDHEELAVFLEALQQAVQQAATLQANAESRVILELKERLDQLYEQASGLADDQTGTREGLQHLTAAIMQAVRQGAAGDALALRELADEETARRLHYALLEHPLVADLLAPQSPIRPEDLAPVLLSAQAAELQAVLELFDADQRSLLARDAAALLEGAPEAPAAAAEALSLIRRQAGE